MRLKLVILVMLLSMSVLVMDTQADPTILGFVAVPDDAHVLIEASAKCFLHQISPEGLIVRHTVPIFSRDDRTAAARRQPIAFA